MSKHLSLQIDPRGHSIYIYLRPIKAGGVSKTEKLGDGLMLDLGPDGAVLGVEMLGTAAVAKLFSLVQSDTRFEALRELSPKESLLSKMIA